MDVDGGGEVERPAQMGRDAQRVIGRRGPVLANREIQRVGGDVLLREKRRNTAHAGGNRPHERRMGQIGRDQLFELSDEPMDAIRRQIEREQLDCNEPFAVCVISAEDRTQRPCTNLMENPKRSERVWGRRAGSFRVQRVLLDGGRRPKFNMVDSFRDALRQ